MHHSSRVGNLQTHWFFRLPTLKDSIVDYDKFIQFTVAYRFEFLIDTFSYEMYRLIVLIILEVSY